MEASPGANDRIKALDGLRAVAILLVFCEHIFSAQLPGGFIGVDIFFVLSGFLITSILLNEWKMSASISFRLFYWRRLLRLTPALAFLLFVYVMIVPRLFGHDHLIAAGFSLYMMNWVYALNIGPQGFLAHTWSLAIEEQFYLLWPITIMFLLRWGQNAVVRTLIVLIATIVIWRLYLIYRGAPINRLYAGSDTRADSLLIGCLLACSSTMASRIASFWMPACLVLAVVAVFVTDDSYLLPCGLFTIVALCSASIISSAASSKQTTIKSLLSLNILVWLGEISYGFYLWHFVVIRMFQAETNLRPRYVGILSFAISVLIAWASSRFIERPFLRLKNYKLAFARQ